MKTVRTILLPVVSVVVLLLGSPSFSQVLPRIASIEPEEAYVGQALTITVHFLSGQTYARVDLAYRAYGESQFQVVEMDLTGTGARATIPTRFVLAPFLEYYLVLTEQNGNVETHPYSEVRDPLTTPPPRTLNIPVRSAEQEEYQILFLSPDPSDVLDAADVVVSVSLLRADTAVAAGATEIALDGSNVTPQAVLAGDLLVFVPSNVGITLTPGIHTVKIAVRDHGGKLYRTALRRFTVRGEGRYSYAPAPPKDFRYSAQVYVESRHEDIAGTGSWYNRGGYQFSGTRGEWRLTSNAFLTSDERSYRQPQNRFFVGLESATVSAGYGDAYPLFPTLILAGKRVRGLHGALHTGVFNIDLAVGNTTRSVEGALLETLPAESLATRQLQDPSSAYARIDSASWGRFSYGTYERELFAIRPSFGSGQTWQLGLTWMTSRDKKNSISYGIRPKENMVVGLDWKSRFDASRIELTAQGAFSAYNSDVSSGSFTDAYIDSVYPNDADQIRGARDLLHRFITVNDNLHPLSLKTLPTLAWEVGLNLNYLNNSLRTAYLYRGSDYTSFGQTYLRRDIRGFNLYDNIRLISNEVLLTLGYERLQDNLSRMKVATTTFATLNAAISYYSTQGLPNVTAGFTRLSSANGLSLTGVNSASAIDDITDRVFFQSTYDLTLGGVHTLIANWSRSTREDRSLLNYDVKNAYASLGVSSRYAIPLQTLVEVGLNYNAVPPQAALGSSGRLDYTAITASGRYGVVPEDVTLFATLTPTFGNVKRTVIDLGIECYILRTMLFTLEASYFRNSGFPNDSFYSLRYRYDI
jgi:hypothetical protein